MISIAEDWLAGDGHVPRDAWQPLLHKPWSTNLGAQTSGQTSRAQATSDAPASGQATPRPGMGGAKALADEFEAGRWARSASSASTTPGPSAPSFQEQLSPEAERSAWNSRLLLWDHSPTTMALSADPDGGANVAAAAL